MYKIYADGVLIYDSTLEDYKIAKGSVSLETNKSGSFTFSLYPDHFYYDRFVRKRTVIKVLKDGEILFRGRVLNDTTDYWNNKVITCEGELGFFHDSTIRPFTFSGTPEAFFRQMIEDHNSQVDAFKRFNVGSVTVVDPNNTIGRLAEEYYDTYEILFTRLIEDTTKGYFYITHGDDGSEDIPTIHYLADFTNISTQKIEFGSNLRDYTKTVKGDDIATVLIPIGKKNDETGEYLTIKSVNGNKDYLEDPEAIKIYGRIVKVESWDDVTEPANLLTRGNTRLGQLINQAITLELSALDLHLLDRSIRPLKVNWYIPISSAPHNFSATLLCNKQTIDLLKPDNDTVTLGYNYSSFTETTAKTNNNVSAIASIRSSVSSVDKTATQAKADANQALSQYTNISKDMSTLSGDIQGVATVVTDLARVVATNATNTATNASNISANATAIGALEGRVTTNEGIIATHTTDITTIKGRLDKVVTDFTALAGRVTKAEADILDLIDRVTKLEEPSPVDPTPTDPTDPSSGEEV